jgi:PmbA protein
MSVVMEQNGESKSGYDYVVLNSLDFDKNELCERCVSDLAKSLNPGKLESGVYSVLIKNSVMQSFIGCFLSSFSGLAAKNRTSPLIGKIGQKIGNDLINFVDLPLDERAHFSQTFDDEGVKTFNKTIVEKGVFKTFMHNQETASFFNTTSTGNGFKNGVSAPVGVNPCNFYLKPGENTLEELFAHVNNGLYITSLQGLHSGVNAVSGSYSLQASGYKIEDGKKTTPVTLIIMSSSIQATLNSITMLGNDFEFKGPFGAPSIALKNIPISGK